MKRKVGVAPGSAIYTGDIEINDPQMTTILYDAKHIEIHEYHLYNDVAQA